MCRNLALTMLLVVASSAMANRSNADLLPPQKVHSPKQCPDGLRVTAKPNDEMIEFVVRIDPDHFEQSKLYKGRVTAICHLDLSVAKDRVAYTQLHARTDKQEMVFRFTISAGAANSSHLDLNTRLHEKDGFPTIGGGKTIQVYLTGFLSSAQQSKQSP